MFTKLKLSTKLWGFTALLLLAVLIVAGNSIWSIDKILSANSDFSHAAEHSEFMLAKEVDHLNWMSQVQELFLQNKAGLEVELDHTQCSLGRFLHGPEGEKLAQSDPFLAEHLEEIKEPHQHLHESGKLIQEVWQQRHEGLVNALKDRLADHQEWAADVSRIVIERNPQIDVQLDHTGCSFGKFLQSDTYAGYAEGFPALRQAMAGVQEPHRRLHESAGEIKDLVRNGDFDAAADVYKNVTLANLQAVQDRFQEAIQAEEAIREAQAEAHHIYDNQTIPAVRATQDEMTVLEERLFEIENVSKAGMLSTGSASKYSSIGVTIVAALLGLILSFFLIRSIVRPITRIVNGLTESSEQVSSASGQVSSASQQLAEGASQQASSLEETSSSLEQIAAQTRQNADNADQAERGMQEAGQVVHSGVEAMQRMNSAITEIKDASNETSRIIKTIDDIAFQTNLLALNAAVEAARAGEAGKGFAVVAEEVRSLAQRSAEAARNTSELIEHSQTSAENGVSVAGDVSGNLERIKESANKVSTLVAEIAAASKEQSEGVEQINTAVSEMDKVVQQNAADSEESASASEELSAQAQEMTGMVEGLMAVVGGLKNGNGQVKAAALSSGFASNNGKRNGNGKLSGGNGASHAPRHRALQSPGNHRPQAVEAPDTVIPLDENDFKDF